MSISSGRARLAGALFLAVFSAALLPPSVVRAALPAPVLVTPVGGVVTTTVVDFEWERVPGAARYQLLVHHERNPGTPFIDVTTVNRRYSWTVPLVGDRAVWTVRALDAHGNVGAAATASFTSARLDWQGLSPPDGAIITHPDMAVTPRWTAIPDTTGGVEFDPQPGTEIGAGTWRWRVAGAPTGSSEGTSSPSSPWRSFTLTWPQGTPVPIAPANGASVASGSSIRLEWQPVPGAGLYRWEFGKVGEYPIATSGSFDVRATWADITTPLEPGTYEWRVRGVMSGTAFPDPIYGPWSAMRTVVVQAPSDPTLTSPADAATVTEWPVLRWTPVPDATSYWLQVADSPDPDAPHRTPGPQVNAFAFDAPGAPGDFYRSTTEPATRYWRVRAAVASGVDSGWTGWRSFTVTPGAGSLTDEVPAALTGPADCDDGTCADVPGLPILRWDPVPGAASYRVFLRWDGGGGGPDAWIDVGSVGMPIRLYPELNVTDHVAWAVLACPSTGCSETMPTARRHFRVGLPAPALLGREDGSVQPGPAVAIQWADLPIPTATDVLPASVGFEVEYAYTPGEFSPRDLYRHGAGRGTYFTRDVLRHGTSLAWRVRSVGPYGYSKPTAGRWSEWRSVTREEPPIALVSPINDAHVGSTPTLDWTPPPFSVINYRVEVARANSLAAFGPEWWMIADHTGATAVTLPELPPGQYRWRVRRISAMYHQGDSDGPWSTGWFTVDGDPSITLLSPTPGASVQANDVLLRWAPFPTATSYFAQIATSPTFLDTTVVYQGYAMSNSHPVSVALPTGQLYWRVCAPVECSESAGLSAGASATSTLQIHAPPGGGSADGTPPVMSGLAHSIPAQALSGSNVRVKLQWAASDPGSGVSNYHLQMSVNGGAFATVSLASPTSTSYERVLTSNRTYQFRVRAKDQAGNISPFSSFPSLNPVVLQEGTSLATYTGTWSTSTNASMSGGKGRYSPWASRRVAITFTGKGVGWVTTRTTSSGRAGVYLDGVLKATFDLDAPSTVYRSIIYRATFATAGRHTLEIRPLGDGRVDIDAFVLLR